MTSTTNIFDAGIGIVGATKYRSALAMLATPEGLALNDWSVQVQPHSTSASKVEVPCYQCGSLVQRYPYQVRKHNRFFCSRECKSAAAVVKRKAHRCETCGARFVPKRSLNQRPSRFCSVKCRSNKAKSDRVVPCDTCGEIIDRPRSQIERSGERGRFCSQRCYGLWESANAVGENSPSYEGSNHRYGYRALANRRSALDRDNFSCQKCGETSSLHVHHIKPFDISDPSTHDLDNLVTWCASCHMSFHANQRSVPRPKEGR